MFNIFDAMVNVNAKLNKINEYYYTNKKTMIYNENITDAITSDLARVLDNTLNEDIDDGYDIDLLLSIRTTSNYYPLRLAIVNKLDTVISDTYLSYVNIVQGDKKIYGPSTNSIIYIPYTLFDFNDKSVSIDKSIKILTDIYTTILSKDKNIKFSPDVYNLIYSDKLDTYSLQMYIAMLCMIYINARNWFIKIDPDWDVIDDVIPKELEDEKYKSLREDIFYIVKKYGTDITTLVNSVQNGSMMIDINGCCL